MCSSNVNMVPLVQPQSIFWMVPNLSLALTETLTSELILWRLSMDCEVTLMVGGSLTTFTVRVSKLFSPALLVMTTVNFFVPMVLHEMVPSVTSPSGQGVPPSQLLLSLK